MFVHSIRKVLFTFAVYFFVSCSLVGCVLGFGYMKLFFVFDLERWRQFPFLDDPYLAKDSSVLYIYSNHFC
jgi:hypothetical protein